jgi:peptide deformylase
MILPIVAYGHPVLRQVCTDITPDYPELKKLLDDMWETMYNAHGMGLAAPQVNRPIRLFVFDTEQVYNNSDEEERKQFEGETGRKAIFINAHITALNGTPWSCDENFVQKTETFKGLNARVILHEYDHIDGKLFIDRISLLKKKLLKKKLDDISAGRVKSGYKMILPKK